MAQRQGKDEPTQAPLNGDSKPESSNGSVSASSHGTGALYRLALRDEEGSLTRVALTLDEISIGRRPGSTIRLTERNISRDHARLCRSGDCFTVEDRGSYNGIELNDRPLKNAQRLAHGDCLRIGDYTLTLEMQTIEVDPSLLGGQVEALAAAMPAENAAAASGEVLPSLPPRLVMLTPPCSGAEFPLLQKRVQVGRADKLDVSIDHRSISREHAEIYTVDGKFRLVDRGSANGTRINGKEVHDTFLKPGDLLELGQVKLTFVPAGQDFQIEEHTLAIPRLTPPGRKAARRGVATLAGLAVFAVGVGVAWWQGAWGGGEGADGKPASADGSMLPARARRPSARGQSLAAERAANEAALATARHCQRLLERGEWQQALGEAETALQGKSQRTIWLACKRNAERQHAEELLFARGTSALMLEDFDGAYFAFEELPRDSAYRQRAEVKRTMDEFAARHLEQAKHAMSRDVQGALRHVNMVLAMLEPPPLRRAAAERLQSALQESGRAVAKSTAADAPSSTAPSSTAPSSTGPSSTVSPKKAGNPAELPPVATKSTACSPMDADYSRCIVHSLEGRARTANELALLVESYRQLHETDKAQQHMQSFITRFPQHRLAAHYQRILSAP